MDYSKRLRIAKAALKLNNQGLANQFGVSKTTISYWLTGKTEMPKTAKILFDHILHECGIDVFKRDEANDLL